MENIRILVKSAIGIKSSAKDGHIDSVISSVIQELQEIYGIAWDETNSNLLMFVVDFCCYRIEKKTEAMPRDLKFRLNNLMVHAGGEDEI